MPALPVLLRAASACAGGIDQLLHGARRQQEKLRSWLRKLSNRSRLARLPIRGCRRTLREVVERRKSGHAQRGKILRHLRYFLHQERPLLQRQELCIVIAPDDELRAQSSGRVRVLATRRQEFVDQLTERACLVALQRHGIDDAI